MTASQAPRRGAPASGLCWRRWPGPRTRPRRRRRRRRRRPPARRRRATSTRGSAWGLRATTATAAGRPGVRQRGRAGGGRAGGDVGRRGLGRRPDAPGASRVAGAEAAPVWRARARGPHLLVVAPAAGGEVCRGALAQRRQERVALAVAAWVAARRGKPRAARRSGRPRTARRGRAACLPVAPPARSAQAARRQPTCCAAGPPLPANYETHLATAARARAPTRRHGHRSRALFAGAGERIAGARAAALALAGASAVARTAIARLVQARAGAGGGRGRRRVSQQGAARQGARPGPVRVGGSKRRRAQASLRLSGARCAAGRRSSAKANTAGHRQQGQSAGRLRPRAGAPHPCARGGVAPEARPAERGRPLAGDACGACSPCCALRSGTRLGGAQVVAPWGHRSNRGSLSARVAGTRRLGLRMPPAQRSPAGAPQELKGGAGRHARAPAAAACGSGFERAHFTYLCCWGQAFQSMPPPADARADTGLHRAAYPTESAARGSLRHPPSPVAAAAAARALLHAACALPRSALTADPRGQSRSEGLILG
jgi:hypothetical protein